MSSLVAALLSWDWFPTPAYTAKIGALCALVHSLMGLGIASQQSVALSRASLHPERTRLVRSLFLGSPGKGFWLHFSWQVPTMMLGNSVVFTLVALAIAVYDNAHKAQCWGPETITAICFTISMVFAIGCYSVSWRCIEWRMQKAFSEIRTGPGANAVPPV